MQKKNDLIKIKRELKHAKYIAENYSKDPSSKCCAIITRKDFSPISYGVNGLPIGFKDENDTLNNREIKKQHIIHAEENAIFFAKENLQESIMFIYPYPPCTLCTSKIIQNKIPELHIWYAKKNDSYDFELSYKILKDANINVNTYENIE